MVAIRAYEHILYCQWKVLKGHDTQINPSPSVLAVSMQIVLVLRAVVWGICFCDFWRHSYNGILFVALIILKNNIHEAWQRHVFSGNNAQVTPDDPQTSLSTVFIGIIFCWWKSPNEKHIEIWGQVTAPTLFIWCGCECKSQLAVSSSTTQLLLFIFTREPALWQHFTQR